MSIKEVHLACCSVETAMRRTCMLPPSWKSRPVSPWIAGQIWGALIKGLAWPCATAAGMVREEMMVACQLLGFVLQCLPKHQGKPHLNLVRHAMPLAHALICQQAQAYAARLTNVAQACCSEHAQSVEGDLFNSLIACHS